MNQNYLHQQQYGYLIEHFSLLDSVEHFSLHAVLKLPPPQHQVEDFVDGVLWIFLQEGQKEVTHRIQTKTHSFVRHVKMFLRSLFT